MKFHTICKEYLMQFVRKFRPGLRKLHSAIKTSGNFKECFLKISSKFLGKFRIIVKKTFCNFYENVGIIVRKFLAILKNISPDFRENVTKV